MLDQLLCLMERYNSYESVIEDGEPYTLQVIPEVLYTMILERGLVTVVRVEGKNPFDAAKELMGTEEWKDIEMFYEGKFEEAREALADAREMMEEQL